MIAIVLAFVMLYDVCESGYLLKIKKSLPCSKILLHLSRLLG